MGGQGVTHGDLFSYRTAFFGDAGISDATELLAKRGLHAHGKTVWMADHFRAAADLVAKWALSDSEHCSVEIEDWFPSDESAALP